MLRKCVTVFAVLGVLTLGCFAQVPKRFRAESLHSRHGFHWTVEHSRHYEFYFEGGSPAARDIEHIETVLENNYAHIVVLLGGKDPDLATKAFVVDSRARMKQLTGRESNGLSVGDVLLFVYGDSVKALGAHEETHLLSYRLWGKPRGIWLAEGLAVYADNDWQGEPLNRICKRLKEEGKLLPLSSLMDDGQFNATDEMVTYPEAGSLVRFIYERYGVDALRAVWSRGAQSIPEVLGIPAAQLEAEWLSGIVTGRQN